MTKCGSGGVAAWISVVAVAFAAGPGGAAHAKPLPMQTVRGLDVHAARIATPAPGALHARRPVRVVVRLAPGVRWFRAHLGRRDVSRAFSPLSGGRTRVALLSRGVRRGTNKLAVRIRGRRGKWDYDVVRFVVARPARGLLRVSTRRAGRGHYRHRLRLRSGAAVVRVSLNGGPLLHTPPDTRGRVRTATVDADDGLRHGRNRLKVVAYTPRGAYDVERRTLVVPRAYPLAGAGADRRVQGRQTIRLSARSSRRATRDGRLRYRWRVVKAPKRARPRLRSASTARPRFRATKHGVYRLRLAVTERRRTGTGAGAAQVTAATDTVTVSAQPYTPPVGIPVTTIGEGGVTIGGSVATTYPQGDDPLQVLVLDRTTLGLVSNTSYADGGAVAAAVAALPTGSAAPLVIIVGRDCCAAGVYSGGLNAAVAAIGGEALPADAGQGFSVVGVPGVPCCSAQENTNLPVSDRQNPGASPVAGNLSGYLQLDDEGHYTYVDSGYVPFSTQSSGGQAAIEVGGSQYASSSLPPGQSGFYVLVLDAASLARRDEGTFATDSGDVGANTQALNAMHGLLQGYTGDRGALVFVQSVGTPDRQEANPAVAAAWNAVSADQQLLGGAYNLFDALDAGDTNGYALVAPGDPPSDFASGNALGLWDSTKVASTAATGSPGQLKGTLSRNNRGQFSPATAGTNLTFDNQVQSVLYQPTVPWPARDTAGRRNAVECVRSALYPSPGAVPLERNYINDELQNQWGGAYTSQLTSWTSAAELPTTPACQAQSGAPAPFTASDFLAVREQLLQEFARVGPVYGLIEYVRSPLGLQEGQAQTLIKQAADSIDTAITPKPGAEVSGDGSDITGAVLDFAWAIGGDVIGPIAGVLDSIYALNAGVQTPGGAPDIDIRTPADNLSVATGNVFQDLWDHADTLGAILLSDWGKLRTSADNIASGSWAHDVQAPDVASASFTLATQGFAYQKLFPLAYSLYHFGSGFSFPTTNPTCGSWGGRFFNESFRPFAKAPNGGLTVVTGAGSKDVWTYGKNDPEFAFLSAFPQYLRRDPTGVPSQGLWNAMFTTRPTPQIDLPAVPSELRFMLDAYDSLHTITRQNLRDNIPPCFVDGKLPGAR